MKLEKFATLIEIYDEEFNPKKYLAWFEKTPEVEGEIVSGRIVKNFSSITGNVEKGEAYVKTIISKPLPRNIEEVTWREVADKIANQYADQGFEIVVEKLVGISGLYYVAKAHTYGDNLSDEDVASALGSVKNASKRLVKTIAAKKEELIELSEKFE